MALTSSSLREKEEEARSRTGVWVERASENSSDSAEAVGWLSGADAEVVVVEAVEEVAVEEVGEGSGLYLRAKQRTMGVSVSG
jgi:hypothetical protein